MGFPHITYYDVISFLGELITVLGPQLGFIANLAW